MKTQTIGIRFEDSQEQLEKNKQEIEEEMPACRICLQETGDIKRLPCKCRGSLSWTHEQCLSEFFKNRIETREFSSVDPLSQLKCEICQTKLDLGLDYEIKWDHIANIQIELFLIVFVMCCLGLVGLQLAETLANEAFKEDKHYVQKFIYFFAYIWLMGVILYLLCEPIFSELRQSKFILKPKNNSDSFSIKMHEQ